MSPQISIIIPIYNAASTLSRCIDSILKQDFTDFEVLLVDDGSNDDSLQIAHRLELMDCTTSPTGDSRIRVFHKTNGGVSSARNLALDNAQGKFICFIDSDDYVEPNYLSSMYSHMSCDMVICGYFVNWENVNSSPNREDRVVLPQVGLYDITNGCDCIYDLFVNGKIHINCNKLLKRSIIEKHNIRYTPISVNEDYMFMIEYLKHAKSVYANEAVTYHWVRVYGQKTGVDSMPDNLLNIYIDAYIKTRPLFRDKSLVDQTFYYTFEFVARKYLIAAKHDSLSKKECNNLLNTMFSAKEVIDCWKAHKVTTCGERLMRFLLQNKLYSIYTFLFL